MIKQAQYKIKGMNRDLSFSAFNPEFAFENKNIRITPIEGNTLLSIVNEKGTKPLNTDKDIVGTVIGYSVINDILILFAAGFKNSIYRITIQDEDSLKVETLYEGDLNFNIHYPIETLSIYENEDNIKVYWVDGYNQPRVINIMSTEPLNDNSFDFVPKIDNIGQTKIKVTKDASSGIFPSGVIQYCFTYFNKNSQETNIVEVSPLYYTSYLDRGASPEESVSNSFSIAIENLDKSFGYVRIYSILRTSLNAEPLCKVVADLKIPNSGNVLIRDTGTLGYTINPTDLLYIGGEVITASTITQKDNTLFLGNLSVNKLSINDIVTYDGHKVVNSLHPSLEFKYDKSITINQGSTGDYPYRNQLNDSSIKIFKYGETYRFGVQFQHESGKWSSPVWMSDNRNDLKPKGKFNTKDTIEVQFGVPNYIFDESKIITALRNAGYRAVRPIVVYPSSVDRSCICQGVINPTVYNVGDRAKGTTFSQASWFFRPNLGIPFTAADSWKDLNDNNTISSNSFGGILTTEINNFPSGKWIAVKDAWAEFRHNYFIPHNGKVNAEIQCIEQYPRLTYEGETTDGWDFYDTIKTTDGKSSLESEYSYKLGGINVVEDFPELFVIDQSIVTFNSPEIEFNYIGQKDLDGTKLRYVGIIPITGNSQDIDIITSTLPRSNEAGNVAPGFIKFSYPKSNIDILAGRRKLTEFHWEDYDVDKSKKSPSYFATYPWHREGSLNNERANVDNYRGALLKEQKRSNLFFSTNSLYIPAIDDSQVEDFVGIGNPQLFNSTENTILKIPSPNNSELEDFVYKGNIDSIITPKFVDKGELTEGSQIIRKANGYYISRSQVPRGESPIDITDRIKVRFYDDENEAITNNFGIDPVNIKYKSSPHAILSYDYTNGIPNIAPTLANKSSETSLNRNTCEYDSLLKETTFWGSKFGYQQYRIYLEPELLSEEGINNIFPIFSWLWLVELYRDVDNDIKFGGKSEAAIESNNWIVAGETKPLELDAKVVWTEGDHYYQRYDCLKTYPSTLEDTNSVVEILSFMCETRINLDGRYDKNRGKSSNLVMTPNNFNLLNPVYTQENNFFTYRAVSEQYAKINKYMNQITWSKTKTYGELIDTWTNISLASILDLDGDKGRIEALRRLNNDIIAFQERGISQILYNDNVQINTTQGAPIEIANSGKVLGKRYLSSSVGCNNKWSICESPMGLYFIDDLTKGIYLFNGNLTNLSDKLGFSTWAKETLNNLELFNFKDRGNIVSYYDANEDEVIFLNNSNSLIYSEKLGTFTSFYDYNNSTSFVKMKDRTILFGTPNKKETIEFFGYHEGLYNMIYDDNYREFYTTLIVNPDPTKDKIFNTVEFRADTWNEEYYIPEESFDTLELQNEYQYSKATSIDDEWPSLNLKKKFRIWRALIPRDLSNHRDRIRNPWVKLKLSKKNSYTNKTVLHDIVVSYTQ